jgi:hypothetical protein
VLEKLLENWLDSASERSYQPVFVQMLSAQGYNVVHSTRHAALEFGKDVLAVAPNGRGCAYQLKGNPGGRLGLAAFRAIQPQLVQLMTQAIVFPGFPTGRHRSYLVSNGFFDEEVQRAADDLNRARYRSKLALISRGDLLIWAKAIGTSLWPSELDDTQLLLELFLADPRDLLPVEKLAILIEKILGMHIGAKTLRREQMDRAIPAAALLVGISTARFAERENHLAVVWAWALFLTMAIGGLERHNLKLRGPTAMALALAESSISSALTALWREVKAKDHLAEGSPFTDPEIYHWRTIILVGALSSLAIKHEASPCLEPGDYDALKAWLLRHDHHFSIWGEGAIASLVPWLVWTQKHEATLRSDLQIDAITKFVIRSNQKDSKAALANPYHSFESLYRQLLPFEKPSKTGEQFAGMSHTALVLFHLLVRTNLKQSCKVLWPDLTTLHHRSLVPDSPWEYCHLAVRSGIDETLVLASEGQWATLRIDARKDCRAAIPPELGRRPWLLGLWWQLAPQRLTPDASRVFANALLPEWGS